MKETHQNQANDNNNGNHELENNDSQDVLFVANYKNEKFTKNIWILNVKTVVIVQILL
jgi:hypothetical protein